MSYFGWNSFPVYPDALIAFAWSAPMRDLAAKVGISDVGLRKQLSSHGIVLPPQGYWNRMRAGKSLPAPPHSSPRKPGASGRVLLDQRFAGLLPEAPAMSSAGPFFSGAVPEDLEQLRAKELSAIGRVSVNKSLERFHPGLAQLLKKEERRRQKGAERDWNWDKPKFDNPLDRRKLRLLNALLLALAKRGHGGDVSDDNGRISARANIGDTWLGIDISPIGRHRTIVRDGYTRACPDLPANTPLALRIELGFDKKHFEEWQDGKATTIETQLAAVAAAAIVAGEMLFRRGLKEAEERAERRHLEEERQRLAKLETLNSQRVQELLRSGELLRQAQEIRALVARVRLAMAEGSAISPEVLHAWEMWALGEADKVDPVVSGQVQSHIRAPDITSI